MHSTGNLRLVDDEGCHAGIRPVVRGWGWDQTVVRGWGWDQIVVRGWGWDQTVVRGWGWD